MRSQACSELQPNAAVSPFAQLVALAAGAPARASHSALTGAVRGTKTEQLVDLIDRNGPLSTARLAKAFGCVNSRIVWGLLKARITSGQVVCRNGLWSMNADYRAADHAELAAAARLLRSHGWRVLAPPREL